MTSMMNIFNGLLTGLFDLVLRPFRGLDPMWALLLVSIVTGILMLWIFGKVSNQETIRVVRDRIRGNLIAIRLFGDDIGLLFRLQARIVRLFGDDIGLLFRLQARIVRQTLTYMRHALVPMLIMIVPVLLILVQLNLNYARRPLEPGEQTTVKVKTREASTVSSVVLEAPDGIAVETEGVRISTLREVAWRVRGEEPGNHLLRVRAGEGPPVEKELRVGGGWAATSELRTGKGILDELLYPGEPPIDGSAAIESIEVIYPGLETKVLGWNLNWMVVFFVVSIAAGFAFRNVLGVEI
jgi:uncharacterized membrane protein (DUF106 family)